MNKRIIYIAGGIVGIFVVIGFISFFILRGGSSEQDDLNDTNQDLTGGLPPSGNVAIDSGQDVPTIDGVRIDDPGFATQIVLEDLRKRSTLFIERLGSYSSDSTLSNFDDVLPQASATLEDILITTKQQRKAEFSTLDSFIGYTVTVVAINTEVGVALDDGVNVVIKAIREITNLEYPLGRNVDETYIVTWRKGEDGRWEVHGISGNF